MSTEQSPGATNDPKPEAKPEGAEGDGTKKPEDSGSQKEKAGEKEGKQEGFSLDGLPEDTQKYIKDLRAESAKYRTQSKSLKDEMTKVQGTLEGVKKAFGLEEKQELTPESFDTLQESKAASEFKTAIIESAYDLGVPKESLGYFSYLVEQKAAGLDEGGEITEEDLTSLAKEASKVSGGFSKTSVDSDKIPDPKPDSGEVGVDGFVKMSTTEKSELYAKNPTVYERLMSQARKERRFL